MRLYAFLAQVLTFADADLEKFYAFARYLRRLLPADRAELPREVQQNIDMTASSAVPLRFFASAIYYRPHFLETSPKGDGYRQR